MISVIVPVYNAGEYLETCVGSVLSQSYGDFELILVNDGSTDGSGERCEDFAGRDPRITVIHRENGGVSNARNIGLDAAKGEVITFLDCDDYILPGMYETLMGKMEEAGADIAVCTVMDDQEDGSVRKVDTGATTIISGSDALRRLVTGMGDNAGHRETIWFSVWNKLYDAKLFRSGIRFDPETDSAEDVPVNLAAFAKAERIVYYEKPYYFWRWREDSQSGLRAPEALRGGMRTSRYIFDFAKTLPEEDRSAAATAAARHFYWYYTGCVYALSLARRRERGSGGSADCNSGGARSAEDYLRLRKDMLASLGAMAGDPFYKRYTNSRFKAAIWLIQRAPGFFGSLWLFYRRLKRP